MICSFFGHFDTPEEVRGRLKDAIIDLILNRGADVFYVGNHGNFDRLAAAVLRELSAIYPHIKYYIVLAYLPEHTQTDAPTIFPEGIENVPKRFAISFRNRFMMNASDFVIAYVTRSFGGASRFTELARKKGAEIINIANASDT